MRRFFVEEIREGKGALVLRGTEANHIRTVLRMAPGDRISVQVSTYDLTRGRIVFRER